MLFYVPTIYEGQFKFLKNEWACPANDIITDHRAQMNIHRETSEQFENRIKPRVYVRRITRSTMYEKGPFC